MSEQEPLILRSDSFRLDCVFVRLLSVTSQISSAVGVSCGLQPVHRSREHNGSVFARCHKRATLEPRMDEARPEIGVSVGPCDGLAGVGRFLALGLGRSRFDPFDQRAVARAPKPSALSSCSISARWRRSMPAPRGRHLGIGREVLVGGFAQPGLRAAAAPWAAESRSPMCSS